MKLSRGTAPVRPAIFVAQPYFLPRGRKGLNGRLIAPAQLRVAVLPPSVQVCVPLSLAPRRTKLPLYFASYCRLPLFQLPED